MFVLNIGAESTCYQTFSSEQMAELKAGVGQPSVERSNSRSIGNTSMSVSIVGEFVQWNEEAIARCTLLTPQVPFLISFRVLLFLSGIFIFS